MATAVWPTDSIAVLTKPLDAPEASCLYREVHQDDFQVTDTSPFLLQWDAVFLLAQPFPFAWSFFFCMFLQVLPASLEMLQRLSCTTRTREAYKFLGGILYVYYCFFSCFNNNNPEFGKWEGKKKGGLFHFVPCLFPSSIKTFLEQTGRGSCHSLY